MYDGKSFTCVGLKFDVVERSDGDAVALFNGDLANERCPALTLTTEGESD
ncbi:hypothetical protein [Halorhabdus sp. CBA1104]|nr:hypothetical protein [Halorhabdus sp. CBA1104]